MDEYISKEFMLKNLEADKMNNAEHCEPVTVQIMERFIRYVKEFPSADVQPVKHGYWEEVIDYGGWGDTHYRCSVCGEEWYLEDGKPKDNNMNFCPRCGARMDGDTDA